MVQGYGFEYDYIDPAFPDAAKVCWPAEACILRPRLTAVGDPSSARHLAFGLLGRLVISLCMNTESAL
jgi:hypothetical protein